MSRVQTRRHVILDSVLRFLASCDRCRSPVAPELARCSCCGQKYIDAVGRVNVFVPNRVLRTFRGCLDDWLNDRWETVSQPMFVHENTQRIQLFCAVARCAQCDEPRLSPDTLRCGGCGRSAQFQENGKIIRGVLAGRLPKGFLMVAQSCYLSERRAAALRHHRRSAVGARQISPTERMLYELQGGQCYYCIRSLASLRTPGGWVCDHLKAKCNGGINAAAQKRDRMHRLPAAAPALRRLDGLNRPPRRGASPTLELRILC
jgi:hypothetical protein